VLASLLARYIFFCPSYSFSILLSIGIFYFWSFFFLVISAVLGLSCFHSILDCIVFVLDVIFGNVQFTTVIMPDFILKLTSK
jgi:hypothetical protein